MGAAAETIGFGAGVLIDNLHRNGIAFTLSLVDEMGHRGFSDQKATPFSCAAGSAVPCPDPPAYVILDVLLKKRRK